MIDKLDLIECVELSPTTCEELLYSTTPSSAYKN